MKREAPTGHFPPAKRSLGQNFLCDANIARRIVDALDITPGDPVLEIGPGQGALTRHIAERSPGRFVALEMDDVLAARLGSEYPRLEVVRGDALRHAWEELGQRDGWKIVGNLPYNIASPLMWEIVSRAGFERAVFMVQLEVAQRIVAAPGGRDYGALSVFVQSHAQARLLFKVPPQVFRPQPKVTSAVLCFKLLDERPDAAAGRRLAATLRLCFQMRRKQLGTILKSNGISGTASLLESLGLDPAARPETLSAKRFLDLANALHPDFPA